MPDEIDRLQFAAALLDDAATLRADAGSSGEGANVSVSLRNGDGAVSQMFALPPLGAAAEIVVDGVTVFAGKVTAIKLDRIATVDLQA